MLSFTLSGNIETGTTNNNNRHHNLFTFTFPYAYNETYSYVTSNSYLITHVGLSFSDSISLSCSYYFHVSCLLQVAIHILYMYDRSDHIQSKLIHIQWQVGTDQSHIKYIQGQIRLI